jgi:hypothetical protein
MTTPITTGFHHNVIVNAFLHKIWLEQFPAISGVLEEYHQTKEVATGLRACKACNIEESIAIGHSVFIPVFIASYVLLDVRKNVIDNALGFGVSAPLRPMMSLTPRMRYLKTPPLTTCSISSGSHANDTLIRVRKRKGFKGIHNWMLGN